MTWASLRLAILLAIVLPLPLPIRPVWDWYWSDSGKVHVGSQADAAREKLLKHTPPGTSASEVLEFVVNDLDSFRHGGSSAYYVYLMEYEASHGRRPDDLGPSDDRTIEVVVSSRTAGLLMSKRLKAIWHFDGQNRLEDVTTSEYGLGP